jgi:excinuclease UvrABC nuclease subunit
MDRCKAPCNLSQTRDEYLLEVEKVRKFLSDYSNGIIKDFEVQIKEYSESLKFEEAGEAKKRLDELKRALLRPENVAGSLDKHDLIVVMPNSERDKTIDVYFIKQNLLVYHQTLGRKANLTEIFELIEDKYYQALSGMRNYNGEEMDQIRIINSWLYRNREFGAMVYIEKKSFDEIKKELVNAIRNITYEVAPEFEDYEGE